MARISQGLDQDIKVISLVCFPHMMSHAYWMAIPPMYPVLIAAFNLTGDFAYTKAAFLTSVFAIATFAFQTPVGFVVDRVGARSVLIAGLAMEATAIGMFGVATAYWQLVALAALAGVGHTVFHPADYAILSARVSERRMGRAFSIHSATGYAGFALSAVFMTGVAALWHWRAAFLLIGIVGLIATLSLVSQAATLQGNVTEKRLADPAGKSAGGGLKLLFSLPVLMCALYFVLHQMGSGGVRSFLVAALGDMHGTPAFLAASALSAFILGSVAGILSGGFVADRFGPRMTTAIATLVPAALLVSLLGWASPAGGLLIALLGAAGFLIGLLIPSRDLLLRSITPSGSMGKVMGFASTGSNLGGALIPLILGYVMDNAGGNWVMWVCACFIGAACLTFVAVRKRNGD